MFFPIHIFENQPPFPSVPVVPIPEPVLSLAEKVEIVQAVAAVVRAMFGG